MPTVHWCYHNNMQENTLGVFTTAAVLLLVLAREAAPGVPTPAAGLMVFAASMAKACRDCSPGRPGRWPWPRIAACFAPWPGRW